MLIFFAISTTLVLTNQGIKLQLPSASSVTKEKKGIVISVNKNREIWLDNMRISENSIKSKIQVLMKKNPDIQVILQADKSTPYVLLIEILDGVRLGGCFDVVLEAKKQK